MLAQLGQIAGRIQTARRRERRQILQPIGQLELAALGDPAAIRQRVGIGAEQRQQPRAGLEVVLGVRPQRRAGRIQRRALPDGDEHILERLAVAPGIMDLCGLGHWG